MLPISLRRIFIIILVCCYNFKNGYSIGVSTKLDFDSSGSSVKQSSSPELVGYSGNAPEISLYEFTNSGQSNVNSEKNKKRSLKSNTIIINHNPDLPDIDKNDETKPEINCDGVKCRITFIKDIDSTSNKNKKISTDVHVKISTDVEQSKEMATDDDDDDIPIVKGYNGVHPKDINYEADTEDEVSPDVKEPSVLITVPKNDNTGSVQSKTPTIIIEPSLYLKPPIFEPSDWQGYLQRKDKNNVEYHPYNINIGNNKYPSNNYPTGDNQEKNDIPQQSDYPSYSNIPGRNNFQAPKPNGWSSWKPIVPLVNSNDHYHYNGHSNGNGVGGWNPQFVTSCTCSRHPVYNPRPTYAPTPRPVYPWYPTEPTTKPTLDGKLLPPFH